MVPTFLSHPRVRLVGAYDPRADARARFTTDFNAASHPDPETLCADPAIQAIYVASPHQFHTAHVELAARNGKHILVEKPMALNISDAVAMIENARKYGVKFLVGHSHSYDTPYLRTRDMISSGLYGKVRMITALNFTDFLYRPRRPEELNTGLGGGVVYSQAAHQADIARLLACSPAISVRASTGNWDAERPTEGAYNVQIQFENGAFASLTYSGYAHFDTDEFNGWIGELGQQRHPDNYGAARSLLKQAGSSADEIKLKERRAYGLLASDSFQPGAEKLAHNHFGLVIASCERADLRPTPQGILVYDDTERRLELLERPAIPRAEVIDELYAAVIEDTEPLHSGEWGLATLEICLAILASSKSNSDVRLNQQI
jgi:phthalate 4,5-cis-dihydrodiol dehydrogenase